MTDGILELHTGLEIGNAANINITGGTIRVEYSFEAKHANSFQPSGGTVEFYGSPSASIKCNSGNFFNNLRINKGASVISYVRDNISVSNDLIIDGGIFRLSELDIPKDIAIGGNVEINTGGKMLLDDSGQITLENEGHLNINNGGVLEIIGAADNKAKLTGISGNYFIDVWSGGVISAEHVIFEKMSADGLNIHPGAIINPVYPLNHCTFQTGAADGTMLTINNDQTLTLEDISFYSDGFEVYNVTKTVDQGNITFVDANGDFAGAEYENDLYGRVNWLVSELSVDPGFLDFLAPNGINFLNVYSNTTWNITDDMDWLGLNLDTPSGDQVVQVSVQMNNTGMVRTGEITVETEDGSIKIIIPVTQQPFVEQIISLPAGWSGLSSYALPGPPFIEDVFSGIEDDLVIALTETGLYYPAENVNTISMWEPFSAYKIKMETATQLEIYGSSYPVKTMNIPAGWSLLPVISECNVDVEMLFAAVADEVVMVKDIAGYGVYWPEMGINTIGVLQPGLAYYILTENEIEITFPECGKSSSLIVPKVFDFSNQAWPEPQKTPLSHSIYIHPEAIENFAQVSLLGAFDESGNCFGITKIETSSNYITLFGDDPTTPVKDGFYEGEVISFKNLSGFGNLTGLEPTFDPQLLSADGLFTENGLSAITGFKGTTGTSETTYLQSVNIYPNPSSGNIFIEGFMPGSTITIMDMHGQEVFEKPLHENDVQQIGLEHLDPGAYMVIIKNSLNMSSHKLILN
jgi:hypothetical protein